MIPKYIVKHGPEGVVQGISHMGENKDYAEGFAAGMNHSIQKGGWRYVEELPIIPSGTRVRFWPGSRDGRSIESKIRSGAKVILLGGMPCQFVDGYAGGISMTHIEVIEEES